MGVLARVRPTLGALAAVKDCGLRGLILEAHGLGHTPAEIGPRLKAFADAAHGIAPNLIVHGLNTPDLVATAAAAGFTHASLWPELKFEAGVAAA
jgi:L-asparaginase/Glu-tRNA(Gln) amidotransferase subunit D